MHIRGKKLFKSSAEFRSSEDEEREIRLLWENGDGKPMKGECQGEEKEIKRWKYGYQ
jgi:hypothetical protein